MIIAMTGGMGVGKSTAIEAVNYTYPDRVKLIKFAAPLYEMQEMIYRRIYAAYKRPDSFVKDRKLLQFLGSDWARESINPDVWVDLWKVEAAKALTTGSIVVCDDCRYDNEAETIKSMGGLIIKITSNDAYKRINTRAGIANHSSESGISDKFVDFTVENNGSPKQFQDKLAEIYKKILPPITVQK